MRETEQLDSDVGYGRHDHLCLAFDDPSDFASQARAFLANGLEQGLRVQWVVAGSCGDGACTGHDVDDARKWLIDQLAPDRADAVQVTSIRDTYGVGHTVSAREQIAVYAEATATALAAGFAGFRVAADVTPLVNTPQQLDAFARYEHLIDRHMRRNPLSALCAYDRATLGAGAVAQVACMHPMTNADSMFRWHAADGDDEDCVEVALSGEVDRSVRTLFSTALDRTDVERGQPIVVDARNVVFIDHHALAELDDLGRRYDARIVMRNAGFMVRRIVALMNLEHVILADPA